MAELAAWPVVPIEDVSWEGTPVPARLCEGWCLFRVRVLDGDMPHAQACGLPECGAATPNALGIGPGDWLLLYPEAARDAAETEIAAAAGYAVEVSDALIILDLHAAAAPISRLTGLEDASFAPGRVARTKLAGIPVILTGLDERTVRMIFDISYARHMRRYLDLAL